MKKLTLAASLVLGLSIAIGASANDGTVTFTGKIVDQTCQVETDSKNLTVKLPTILNQHYLQLEVLQDELLLI